MWVDRPMVGINLFGLSSEPDLHRRREYRSSELPGASLVDWYRGAFTPLRVHVTPSGHDRASPEALSIIASPLLRKCSDQAHSAWCEPLRWAIERAVRGGGTLLKRLGFGFERFASRFEG